MSDQQPTSDPSTIADEDGESNPAQNQQAYAEEADQSQLQSLSLVETDDIPDQTVTPSLELRSARKVYDGDGGRVVALDEIAFAALPGEFVAVVGPSGSGKSTLLNVLGLLDDPSDGDRYLEGTEVTTLDEAERTAARKESIGFVFQDFHLLPTLTAMENVALPTTFDSGDASARATELLTRFGLGDRTSHTPNELSGGQKQRVAIARALINKPAVLLADEPTGNLDTDTGTEILAEFERIRKDGVAVIAVTHDPLVEDYADRVVELTDGVVSENAHPLMDSTTEFEWAPDAKLSPPDAQSLGDQSGDEFQRAETGPARDTVTGDENAIANEDTTSADSEPEATGQAERTLTESPSDEGSG